MDIIVFKFCVLDGVCTFRLDLFVLEYRFARLRFGFVVWVYI